MKTKTKKITKKILTGAFALSLAFPFASSVSNNNAQALTEKSKYDYGITFRTADNKPIRTDDGWWHLSEYTSVGNLNELEFADYELFNCYLSEIQNASTLAGMPERIESYKKAIAIYEEAEKTGTFHDLGNGEKAVWSSEWGWVDKNKYKMLKRFVKQTEALIPELEYQLNERPAIKKYEAKYRSVAKKEIDKLEYLTANQKEESKRKIDNVESKIVNGKSADIRFKCEDILKSAKQLNEKNKAEGKKPEVSNTNSNNLDVTPSQEGSWQCNSTGWWYQNADGSYPVSQWQQINGSWYYFNESGYMVANMWIGNYYLGESGAMLTNTTTPDGYTVGSDGAWLQNTGSWQQNSTGWWYQNADGSYPANEWQQINGSWYYFNESGYMVASMWIGNYYLGESGAMLTDTVTPDGYTVDENGAWIA